MGHNQKMGKIKGMAMIILCLMANTLNAETVSISFSKDITVVESSVELKTVFSRNLGVSVNFVTSIAITSAGTNLFGIFAGGNLFIVIDEKGNVIFKKEGYWGKVSNDGKRVFVYNSSKCEYGDELIEMDLKGNILKRVQSPLIFRITDNNQYFAEFGDIEHPSNRFILTEMSTNKVVWSRDFPWNWEGKLLYDGSLILNPNPYDEKADSITIFLYGPNGEESWRYIFPKGYKYPDIYTGRNCFIVCVDEKKDIENKRLFVFNKQKGMLWDKKINRSQMGMSQNDRYIGVLELTAKELILFELSSGKEIYRTQMPQNLRYIGLNVSEQGKIALKHRGGIIIVDSEGKIIAEFSVSSRPECYWVSENLILLFSGNSIQMVRIGK